MPAATTVDGDFVVDSADHDLFITDDPSRTFSVSFRAFLSASCATNVGSCSLLSSSVAWGHLSCTSTRGEMTVEYTFNEPTSGVPEPSTFFLLGTGLIGIVSNARRNPR